MVQFSRTRYGRGSGPMWLDDLYCKGDEVSLAECRHRGWGVHDCGFYYRDIGASVYCDNSKC